MEASNKIDSLNSIEFKIPYYKKPLFASIIIGILSLAIIIYTQRRLTIHMETEIALVTEISVATVCMFILFIVVNQLQSNISRIEALNKHSREIEILRNEFTSIASRDIAEASTAIKWGIRTLEPDFEQLKKTDLETLLHIRDKNDHILEIVRSLVILSRIERKEIVVSPSQTNISGVIENLLHAMEPRIKAKGTKLSFEIPVENVIIDTDHIVLSELLQSLFTYCLERTRGTQDTVSIRTFTVNEGIKATAKITISDNAPPVEEYMRTNIFARAIHNPHTGDLENTQLGPHVAKLLSDLIGANIEASLTESQTSFTISFPSVDNHK
jgi:signal transduction histidine kinase